MKTWLAERSYGRVLLHLVCLLRDGKWRWHWCGILREIREFVTQGQAETPTTI